MSSNSNTLEQYMNIGLKGVKGTVIKSTVRKTFQRKQFEPEVIELTSEQVYDRQFTPLEMAVVTELNKVGIEYSLFVQLYALKEIEVGAFKERKDIMLSTLGNLINKLREEDPQSTVLAEVTEALNKLRKEMI